MAEGWDTQDGAFAFPVVEGPPGTGKTTVGVVGAAEYVVQEPDAQVAYLAYTNFAAEKAREELFKLGFDSESVIRLSANPREKNWEKGVVGCQTSLDDLTPNEQRRLRKARILISTLHASGRIFEIFARPLVVIDEFSQVSPSLFFSTIAKVSTTSKHNPCGYVLLGDPNQLPVITSQPLLRPNVGTFLLARKRNYEPHQLEIQYRMNELICDGVNALREALNTYPLKTDDAVRRRTLKSLGFEYDGSGLSGNVQQMLEPDYPLVLVDTDGLRGEEQVGFGQSKFFPSEAEWAGRVAQALRSAYTDKQGEKLAPTILSPYTAQIGTIQSLTRDPALQANCITIYKAQGREYPAVIVSFARKNPRGEIGFLAEPELRSQTYVACSRAMAKLILLFSFSTFKGYRDFGTLLERIGDSAFIVKARGSWEG